MRSARACWARAERWPRSNALRSAAARAARSAAASSADGCAGAGAGLVVWAVRSVCFDGVGERPPESSETASTTSAMPATAYTATITTGLRSAAPRLGFGAGGVACEAPKAAAPRADGIGWPAPSGSARRDGSS